MDRGTHALNLEGLMGEIAIALSEWANGRRTTGGDDGAGS